MVLLLCACSGITVDMDYDREARFEDLKTYAWLKPRATGNPRIDNRLVELRIMEAVNERLQARGYERVSKDEADFLVLYHAALGLQTGRNTVHDPGPYSYSWRVSSTHSTIVRQMDRGSLLLDFVNPKTRHLIWRGTAEAKLVHGAAPDDGGKRIRSAVDKMLKRFPPK